MTMPVMPCPVCGVELTTTSEMFEHGRVCVTRAIQKRVEEAVAKAVAARMAEVEEQLKHEIPITIDQLWGIIEELELPISHTDFMAAVEAKTGPRPTPH